MYVQSREQSVSVGRVPKVECPTHGQEVTGLNHAIGKVLQWHSQNTEKHQRETTVSSNDSLQLRPFSKWELLLKERICSQRESNLH